MAVIVESLYNDGHKTDNNNNSLKFINMQELKLCVWPSLLWPSFFVAIIGHRVAEHCRAEPRYLLVHEVDYIPAFGPKLLTKPTVGGLFV